MHITLPTSAASGLRVPCRVHIVRTSHVHKLAPITWVATLCLWARMKFVHFEPTLCTYFVPSLFMARGSPVSWLDFRTCRPHRSLVRARATYRASAQRTRLASGGRGACTFEPVSEGSRGSCVRP